MRSLSYLLTSFLPSLGLAALIIACLAELGYSTDGTETITNSLRSRSDAAMEYFEQGNLLCVEHDRCEDSLPFYRAAVRLDPSNIDYWIRLVNAESRSGFGDPRLRRRLLKLHQLGLPEEALTTLSTSWGLSFNSSDLQGIKSNEQCTQVHDFSHPLEEYRDNSQWDQPFVYRDFFTPTTLTSIPITDLHFVRREFGAQKVEFYPQNMLERPSRVYNVPFAEALDFLSYPEGAYVGTDISEPGTYMQWNVPIHIFRALLPAEISTLSEEEKIRKQTLWSQLQSMGKFDELFLMKFAPGETVDNKRAAASFQWPQLALHKHWNMLLIGEAGAGMFHHTDSLPVGSWQVQLEGTKYWKICPPAMNDSETKVDSASPQCLEVILQPGDLLYYPPRFSHSTLCCATPTISFSSSVFRSTHAEDVRDMVTTMQYRCRPDTPTVKYSSTVCQWFAIEDSASAIPTNDDEF